MSFFKEHTPRSRGIMRWARGHDAGCQMRVPGMCQWGPTVGSHVPKGVQFGKGTGHKPPDLVCLTCDTCHKVADGQIKTPFEPLEIQVWWWEGFYRTLLLAVQDGKVEIL